MENSGWGKQCVLNEHRNFSKTKFLHEGKVT